MVDYSAGRKAALPNEDELKTISALAEKQVAVEKQIKDAEDKVKDLKREYQQIRTEALPEAMKQVGLSEFALSDGSKITVADDLNCNIKVANRAEAFDWLRKNGHGDIIKNEVILAFGTGEDLLKNEAVAFAEEHDFQYTAKENVHNNTLTAWAKRQLVVQGEDDVESEEIPEDLINIFRYSVAKVTLPKKTRKR